MHLRLLFLFLHFYLICLYIIMITTMNLSEIAVVMVWNDLKHFPCKRSLLLFHFIFNSFGIKCFNMKWINSSKQKIKEPMKSCHNNLKSKILKYWRNACFIMIKNPVDLILVIKNVNKTPPWIRYERLKWKIND